MPSKCENCRHFSLTSDEILCTEGVIDKRSSSQITMNALGESQSCVPARSVTAKATDDSCTSSLAIPKLVRPLKCQIRDLRSRHRNSSRSPVRVRLLKPQPEVPDETRST